MRHVLLLVPLFGLAYSTNLTSQALYLPLALFSPKIKCQPAQNNYVLLWTGKWAAKYPLSRMDCKCDNCQMTTDRKKLNESRVVVFDLKKIDLKDLPPKINENHKWILVNHEPPVKTVYKKHIFVALEGKIDWMMTYRKDAGVYSPYGKLTPKRYPATHRRRVSLKNKAKSVVWFVSHPNAHSNRDMLVKLLSRYIDVDIYGENRRLTCVKKTRQQWCYRMAAKQYKFYLSFENSICKDYVTEKLYNILDYDLIPVVLGGADYQSLLPPNSFIDALRFDRVEQLAHYLREVGSNEELYNSFFVWKTRYNISHERTLCSICDKLNQPEAEWIERDRAPRNLTSWWFEESRCTPWKPKKGDTGHRQSHL